MSDRKISRIAKALMLMKERIDTPAKWCKGTFKNQDGQMCIKGAIFCDIDKVVLPAWTEDRCYRIINDLAFKRTGVLRTADTCPIVEFNDREETTHKDVMELFDEAIAKEVSDCHV